MISTDGPAMLNVTALALLSGLSGSIPPPNSPPNPPPPSFLGPRRSFLSPLPVRLRREVNCVKRVKDTDFERAMKLVTTRIDVHDKLMQLVFKEAKDIGALQFTH
jgi:hypothetical protein